MDGVSESVKDFISKLLTVHVDRRFTADEALAHQWILIHNQSGENDKYALVDAIKNISKYNAKQKLQEAVINFVVHELAAKEDMANLQNAFKILDKEN